jgi:hypothetical protein
MKRLVVVGVLSAVAVVALVGSATASAATEFGDNCDANKVLPTSIPATLFASTAAGDPLSLTAPSAGVITRWTLNLSPVEAASFAQTLRVLHPTGPNTVQVVGEATQTVTGGSNSFETRIPVQAGDRLGLSGVGAEAILYCEQSGPKNLLNVFENTGGVGSTGIIKTENQPEAEARVPVFAVIEPDADGDGYGDETQDKCPTNASTQGPCPTPTTLMPITLSVSPSVKRGSVTVIVTSSAQATVTVAGTANLGKGKPAKLSGGTQVVVPALLAKFTVPFPSTLKSKLKHLSRSKSLPLKLEATASGAATTDVTVKVKGQMKTAQRHQKH